MIATEGNEPHVRNPGVGFGVEGTTRWALFRPACI
jgi:hypothetical protein